MIRELLLACGLVLVLEGLLYAFVPGQLKRMAKFLESQGEEQLRIGGAVAIALGVGLVWLVQGFYR